MGFSQGLKNEFETAEVKEPSMFEQLKFYCTLFFLFPVPDTAEKQQKQRVESINMHSQTSKPSKRYFISLFLGLTLVQRPNTRFLPFYFIYFFFRPFFSQERPVQQFRGTDYAHVLSSSNNNLHCELEDTLLLLKIHLRWNEITA